MTVKNSKTESSIITYKWGWLSIGLLIGLGLGYFIFPLGIQSTTVNTSLEKEVNVISHIKKYSFLNPSIDYLDYASTDPTAIDGLERQLIHQLESAKSMGEVVSAAIYFKDLTTNQKVGINEDEDFSPASLMKVPIMIAVLKYAESKPHVLDQKITYLSWYTAIRVPWRRKQEHEITH